MIVMNEEYEATYCSMLADVFEKGNIGERDVTTFWPMVGDNYQRNTGMLIVGRSVNGWKSPKHRDDFSSEPMRMEVAATTRQESEGGRESEGASERPMQWVVNSEGKKGYNSRRSAFWRIAKKTASMVLGHGFDDQTWPSFLAWTNLMKVSPQEKGGNPGVRMRSAQTPRCVELFKEEVEFLSPRFVLVMAGGGWYETFIEDLQISFTRESAGSLIEKVGSRVSSLWILAKHPQGKPEDPFMEEVSKALQLK